MGGIGCECCENCCDSIELPDETWSAGEHPCCISKTIENGDDTWHYVCSGIIRECTQTQSVDLRIYRHLFPVVAYTYTTIEPDPIECEVHGDCYIHGETLPHCDNSTEECGVVSLYGTVNTKQKLVLKYKHIRDVITITKTKCGGICKHLVVFTKLYQGYWGQVSFGSSTRTVTSLSGCCKVIGSSSVVAELTCQQAADALLTGGFFTLSRSEVYDELPEDFDFESGQQADCEDQTDPSPGACIAIGSDGPIIGSIDVPIFLYPDAVCSCSTELVRCFVITVGTHIPSGAFGCIIREPYPSERHSKYICGAETPGPLKLLPGYAITYDGTYCYVDCGESIGTLTDGTLTCPPYPPTACRAVNGFISKVLCEDLTSNTYCSPYTPQTISIDTESWGATL